MDHCQNRTVLKSMLSRRPPYFFPLSAAKTLEKRHINTYQFNKHSSFRALQQNN